MTRIRVCGQVLVWIPKLGFSRCLQVRARLDGLIKDSPVLFLNFETCPYCVKAKAILDEKNCRYVRLGSKSDLVDDDNTGSCCRRIPKCTSIRA
jgi:hypothetical protein